MAKLFHKGVTKEEETELREVEASLRRALVPVKPPSGYVQELKQRLNTECELEFVDPRPVLVQKILLATAGLLSGVLLIALGVRGFIALANSIKNALPPKRTPTVRPVV